MSDERALAVDFAVASQRLEQLSSGHLLDSVSERVYRDGVEHLLRVGPAGTIPGASRLVWVRFAAPVRRGGTMTAAMRWEATGATGKLFPALDADIQVSENGDGLARVRMTGSYRPPLGALGSTLDRMLLHAVATATIKTLVTQIAAALEGAPAPAIEPDTT